MASAMAPTLQLVAFTQLIATQQRPTLVNFLFYARKWILWDRYHFPESQSVGEIK
jgi:hypothetical protein